MSLFLVNMPFTKEYKLLIKNLFELKGYGARHLVREFSKTRNSAMAEGPCDALVSRNSAITKYPYRMELFA